MKKFYSTAIFIIVLLAVSIYYNYHEIVFKRPQSVHKWRQSDCASIALNYFQGGMNFLKAETHNLTSDKGTTGKSCTSEIPILYYTVAALYKVFGYHEFIYRIFNTLLFFLGLFYLFRLLRFLLKDVFWSVALTLLFFTSPVLIYYGNNFLSNSSALAFSIIGWYYFILFYSGGEKKWLYTSLIIFLLAAAFKVTAFFSLFAISGIFLLEYFNVKKFKTEEKLFKKPIHFILPALFVFMSIILWLLYAHYYNQRHDCTYFSTTTFPIWNLDREGIMNVVNSIRNLWIDQYFHKSVLLFLTICFLFSVIFFKRNTPLLIASILIIFAEAVVYVVLQFWTFANHDYYVIDMFILPIMIVIATFDLMKQHFSRVFKSIPLKLTFSIFLLFNIYYGHKQINARYSGWMNDYTENADVYSVTPYLREIGINANDTIISIPDGSNASLYLMNQKGWTEYTDARFNRGSKLRYNQDSAGIQSSITKGAKYLIVNGVNELYSKTYLQGYCTNLAGKYNNVLIFNLKDSTRNFKVERNQIVKRYSCDSEILSADGQFFVNVSDTTAFESGITRSDDFARSGKYSSALDAKAPYGMTYRIKELKNGERFVISVWRKSSVNAKAGIVASSLSSSIYNFASQAVETDSEGWEKIQLEFTVTGKISGQEMTVYLYNPETELVYFDDLEIIRYNK
jgi:hypothetical protein